MHTFKSAKENMSKIKQQLIIQKATVQSSTGKGSTHMSTGNSGTHAQVLSPAHAQENMQEFKLDKEIEERSKQERDGRDERGLEI